MIMDVLVHVSPVIEQHHMLGRDPFAFQSLVLGPVDKVRHTQPLQAQLKHESKTKLLLVNSYLQRTR